MKRPLAIVAFLYMGGILLGWLAPVPPGWLVAAGFLLLAAACAWSAGRPFLLFPLIVLAGWANLASRAFPVDPFDLRLAAGQDPAIATIRGRLVETPSTREFDRGGERVFLTQARLEVAQMLRGGRWAETHGRIAVSTPAAIGPAFFGGRQVEISGVLDRPSLPSYPGQFNFRAWLENQEIFYQLRTDTSNDWALAWNEPAGRRPPLSDRFLQWAQTALARGLPGDDPCMRLLWTMMLGNKTTLSEEAAEPFMRSGTLHIFAISGLHIALISGILVSVLRAARVPREFCGLAVIPLLWLYTGATGWQPSAIRSTVMMTVVLAGWALRRPGDLLNSLAGAALALLAWQPGQLFQAGFQLSFFVVLAIAVIVPGIEPWLKEMFKPDPMLPADLRPAWRRHLNGALRWVVLSASVSLAAWAGSLPLIAHYFNLVTPASLLANLVVVPISNVCLAASMASLAFAPLLPPVSELFNHSAWLSMKWMAGLSEWFAGWPFAYRYVPKPPVWLMTLYGAVLCAFLNEKLWKSRWRNGTLAASGAVLAVSIGAWLWIEQRTQLLVPALGGSGIYFDAPGVKDDLLIDCGNTNSAQTLVTRMLRAQGVHRLQSLLLTHGDAQHVGGFDHLDEEFRFQQISATTNRSRSGPYRKVLENLAGPSADRWQKIRRGDTLGAWRVLHPGPGDNFPRADDNAVVLFGEFNGTRVLLLSDLGQIGQEKLLEREPGLRADIVITGLPSDGEPLRQILAETIRPKLIVVASAEFGLSSRVSRKTRERLARLDAPVVFTDEAGTAVLEFPEGQPWMLHTARQSAAISAKERTEDRQVTEPEDE